MHPPELNQDDISILRRLAEAQAEVAALPVHREKAELWRRLNQREPVRPMVYINEICWNEMDVDGELALRCTHPWARDQEQGLRQLLYQWRHLPGDMIVDDYLTCPLVIHSTGFGIQPLEDIIRSDETSAVVSHHYRPQFRQLKDVEKIQDPLITFDAEATAANFERMERVYADILPVRKVGIKGAWFSPWDRLVELWGVEQALTDLVDRPELVHAAMERFVAAHLCMLDQWEALDLLARNDDNTRIGSGGYGYTAELPGALAEGLPLSAENLWGCATAQIFSDVSPRMHWEFALQYELRWLQRWGLTYYGCCEPLDRKIEILRRIPNLRKLSVSPWNNTARIVALAGGDYVLSRKPNPALLAKDAWDVAEAEADLRAFLDQARGLSIEVILKDLSTLRYEPRRLWDWEKMAMRVVEEYAPR
jgi:hypothetical protein